MDQHSGELENPSVPNEELNSFNTIEKYGYELEDLYKIAVKFFKGIIQLLIIFSMSTRNRM